ncbi:MAG: DoxX family membrane protein [Chloroflexi bacterium]|nr:DoxX family membrane protein [Chloroflexota bacterium]
MARERTILPRHDLAAGWQPVRFQDPPLVQALLGDTSLAWLWLVVRVYLGWQWLEAGWAKVQDPAWAHGGAALQEFLVGAVQTEPRPVAAYDWYRGWLQLLLDTGSYTWLAQFIAYAETLVGIALILGLFTGPAAFLGSLLNFNFMLAGSVSTNPVLFALATWLVLAWKTAGWIGLDRWLLPTIGTPWQHPERASGGQSAVAHRRPPPAGH